MPLPLNAPRTVLHPHWPTERIGLQNRNLGQAPAVDAAEPKATAMRHRNAIHETVDSYCTSREMVKKSGSWFSRSESVTTVVNLQKSQHGPSYYINVGFWFQEIDEQQFPPPNKCHIVSRLSSWLPISEERELVDLLNLETPIHDDPRAEALTGLLDRHLSPVLAEARTADWFLSPDGEAIRSRSGVKAAAQQLLAGQT